MEKQKHHLYFNHNFLFSFTGEVKALTDVWFIGDDFVNEHFHILPEMKNKAAISKSEIPYLYQQYNVKCFASNLLSQLKDILTRLVNALVKALNDHQVLPRFVIVIPDDDIVHHALKYDVGVSMPVGAAINWLANQMIRAVACKKGIFKKG